MQQENPGSFEERTWMEELGGEPIEGTGLEEEEPDPQIPAEEGGR